MFKKMRSQVVPHMSLYIPTPVTDSYACQRTIKMCIYEGVLRVHVQQHQLDAAILAVVIVNERSGRVYMMVVYSYMCNNTSLMLLYWQL